MAITKIIFTIAIIYFAYIFNAWIIRTDANGFYYLCNLILLAMWFLVLTRGTFNWRNILKK